MSLMYLYFFWDNKNVILCNKIICPLQMNKLPHYTKRIPAILGLTVFAPHGPVSSLSNTHKKTLFNSGQTFHLSSNWPIPSLYGETE